jgi:hypothetical protein
LALLRELLLTRIGENQDNLGFRFAIEDRSFYIRLTGKHLFAEPVEPLVKEIAKSGDELLRVPAIDAAVSI